MQPLATAPVRLGAPPASAGLTGTGTGWGLGGGLPLGPAAAAMQQQKGGSTFKGQAGKGAGRRGQGKGEPGVPLTAERQEGTTACHGGKEASHLGSVVRGRVATYHQNGLNLPWRARLPDLPRSRGTTSPCPTIGCSKIWKPPMNGLRGSAELLMQWSYM